MKTKSLIYTILLIFAVLGDQIGYAQAVAGDDVTVESELSFRRFTTIDGLPQMQAELVWQDSRGYIYFGTLSGFVRYDGATLTPFLKGRRENIVGFREVAGKTRAFGFVRQWTVEGNKAAMSQIDPQGNLLLNNFNAADLPEGFILLEDKQEENRRLCKIDENGYKIVMDNPLLDTMTPDRKMFIDRDDYYLPSPQGLYRIHNNRAQQLSDKTDFFSLIRVKETLYAFAADGIYSIAANGTVSPVYEFRFEAPDYGLAVRQNAQGQLVIADSHSIWVYDKNSHEVMRRLTTGFNLIKGIFIDSWNRLWAATYQGVYCFFYCNFENHFLTDRNDIVRAITWHNGQPVMGTLNGRVLVGGKTVSSREGNFFAPAAATLGDKVYMAGNGDVACVQGNTVTWLGLPDDKYKFVSTFGDRLIIATRTAVLAYNPETSAIDTLAADIVNPWCVADDGRGRLWVACNPGLFCLENAEATDAQPALKQVKSTPSSLIISAMSSDRKGHVFFALGDSLFAIDNGKMRAVNEAQPVLQGHEIRSLYLSRRGFLVVAAIDGLMVARVNSEGTVEEPYWFDATNGFTMIEPLNAAMTETDDGTIWLAGLEGMTSFNPENLLADSQKSTIVVTPRPWWQQWWMVLIAIAALSFIVWRITRHIEKRVARKKMEQLEREKKQKDLQLNAVRLKAIPHFHSNVLASIEYFIMNNSADEASHYLKLYSDFTNQTLTQIDRPSRSIADEVDYVSKYLELERLRYGERMEYEIHVADDVDQNVQLPNMILHTYCQNAVKHGIAAKAGDGKIVVGISRSEHDGADGVTVVVSDNGVGRVSAAKQGGSSTKQGLKILQQQIELYNKANQHKIEQKVTDLTDAQGRPAGTRFEIWVPAKFVY